MTGNFNLISQPGEITLGVNGIYENINQNYGRAEETKQTDYL
jgi:hypothetical protein